VEADAHSRHWDRYVESWQGDGWPGDEWSNPRGWEAVYRRFFVGVESWGKAVEIGPGSGKYTEKVLANPTVEVRAYDVSAKFLEVCRERLPSERLDLRKIDTSSPRFLLDDLADWKRQVDALYSIGVMVHIDLLYLMPYLITAAAVLKPGGKLIATFGNPTTERGFERLLAEIQSFWNNPGGKYEVARRMRRGVAAAPAWLRDRDAQRAEPHQCGRGGGARSSGDRGRVGPLPHVQSPRLGENRYSGFPVSRFPVFAVICGFLYRDPLGPVPRNAGGRTDPP
jgi:SAM-dependent methyltransferase